MALTFKNEVALGRYLFVHLSFLLSELDMDILILRRETAINAGRVDLLGIDARGVLYIFELKVGTTKPSIIGQVIAYRRAIRTMHADQLIESIRSGPGGVNLVTEFERHFGHPIPEVTDPKPVMVLIARAFDTNTARCVMELADEEFSIIPFRYFVAGDRVELVRARRMDGTVDLTPPGRRRPWSEWRDAHIRPDVREFCATHLHSVVPSVMTFSGIYDMYMRWLVEQEALGREMQFLQPRNFARELAKFMANSAHWVRGLALPGTMIDPHKPLEVLPSLRPRQTEGHRIVAYRRVP